MDACLSRYGGMTRHEVIWLTPAAALASMMRAAREASGEREDDDWERLAAERFMERYQEMRQ